MKKKPSAQSLKTFTAIVDQVIAIVADRTDKPNEPIAPSESEMYMDVYKRLDRIERNIISLDELYTMLSRSDATGEVCIRASAAGLSLEQKSTQKSKKYDQAVLRYTQHCATYQTLLERWVNNANRYAELTSTLLANLKLVLEVYNYYSRLAIDKISASRIDAFNENNNDHQDIYQHSINDIILISLMLMTSIDVKPLMAKHSVYGISSPRRGEFVFDRDDNEWTEVITNFREYLRI